MDFIKKYTLWIERLKKIGLRDRENPFKFLSPDHPLTLKEIERLNIELDYAKEKISLNEYHKRYEKLNN